jgi:acetolactate synthase-1/2/3 large subunit
MNVCQYIASELADRGVKFVFGIPGGPSIPYIEEFRKKGIEFILTANETSAGIMADVTGRLTGIPGVCHATFGPGATNLATGVGGALLDRSPLIALTSEVPVELSRRTVQMNIDHHSLFEPITKASIRMNADSAGEIIADAFDLAMSEYPGPVHIGLPSDIAEEEVSSLSAGYTNEEWDQETIIDSETATLFEYSRKPIIALGLSAVRYDITEEIHRFLEKHPMPLVVTPMAKGIVKEDHPCYSGVLFHALSDRLAPLIEEADLVIGFGYDPVEYNYESWVKDIPLVHINTIPADMPCDIMSKQVTGGLEGILDMISSLISHDTDWDLKDIKEIRDLILEKGKEESNIFGPLSLLNSLKNSIPEDSILTLDVGSHIHLFGQFWPAYGNKSLLMTNGWSGMGFAIPAAIAAALNFPKKRVVAVCGDGGFLMNPGEVILARRLKLNIVFIILTDRELNLIKLKKEKRGLSPDDMTLYSGELFDSDTFLGIPVVKASSRDSSDRLLSDAFASVGPLIIDAEIDPSGYKDLIIV